MELNRNGSGTGVSRVGNPGDPAILRARVRQGSGAASGDATRRAGVKQLM